MTLEEAMSAKKLMCLEPFRGWKPCGKLTGRYFYDTATGSEDPEYLKVEVRESLFSTKWVFLSHIQAVKEVMK